MNKTAYFPGTFDPITNGHLNLIERIHDLFGNVTVLIAENRNKKQAFNLAQRVEMVENSLAHLANAKVVTFTGILPDFFENKINSVIVRGIRNAQDMSYEMQLYQSYTALGLESEFLLLPAHTSLEFLSSSMVRELLHFNKDVSSYIPNRAFEELNK